MLKTISFDAQFKVWEFFIKEPTKILGIFVT